MTAIKTEYALGLDHGLDLAVNELNKELGTDFDNLGQVLQHLWNMKRIIRDLKEAA